MFRSIRLIGLGVVSTIILLELIFQMLPVTTGFDYQNTAQADPVLRSKVPFTRHSLDWKFHQAQTRKVNNYGFPDDIDYAPNSKPIAVIGDSYVQSLMLPYADTLQGQLHTLLKQSNLNHPVYSFGVPGYSLASYIGSAEFASKTFQPQLFVFLLTEEDITSSLATKTGGSYFLNPHDWKIEFRPTKPSRISQVILKSALVRYLIFHLQIKPPEPVATGTKTDSIDVNRLSHRLLDYLEQRSMVRPENTIFIIDCDRDKIYQRQPQPQTAPANQLSLFAQIAHNRGYSIIDTLPLFTRQYQQSNRRLDFKPLDIHWNSATHQLVAKTVYPMISNKLALRTTQEAHLNSP